jgi:hypothetical protein
MTRQDAETAYDFWLQRQSDDQIPLVFSSQLQVGKVKEAQESASISEGSDDQPRGAHAREIGKQKKTTVQSDALPSAPPAPNSPAAAKNKQEFLEGLSQNSSFVRALKLLDYAVCLLPDASC